MRRLKRRLKELSAGQSLTAIAAKSGLCKSAVSKLLNANRYLYPRFESIVAIADAVGLPADEAFALGRKEQNQ